MGSGETGCADIRSYLHDYEQPNIVRSYCSTVDDSHGGLAAMTHSLHIGATLCVIALIVEKQQNARPAREPLTRAGNLILNPLLAPAW